MKLPGISKYLLVLRGDVTVSPTIRISPSLSSESDFCIAHSVMFLNVHAPPRIATVTLTRCSTSTVLNAFTKCLALLPNLRTLQIVHTHSQMTTTLKNHFEGKSFPQIRNIILPSCAHNILRACPGVTSVTCNEDDGSKLVSAIRASCKGVVHVSGIRAEESIMKREFPSPRRKRVIHESNFSVR